MNPWLRFVNCLLTDFIPRCLASLKFTHDNTTAASSVANQKVEYLWRLVRGSVEICDVHRS